MIDRLKPENVILVADRVYENYNILHMQLKKDGNSLYVSKIKIVIELHLG